MKKFASATDSLWYKDALIYELHVRAFSDSNGDGIGDFQGLISRLDYLQDLGITCIWLLPFFPSPLRDDGYDIANYVDVNPSYGTLNDFKAFLAAAHQRNMQVMIELVINHTSDQHPWFQAARLAPPGSPQREMYVWSQTDQVYKEARIIFTDTEKSNWTWDETAKAYYWHRFFSHQPDLNFENPLVIEEVLKAMRFWLDMGVDGLRMDAIPYLCERDGTSCENLPETHAVIRKIRATIEAEYENRLILAEANQWPADVRPYFGEGDECHMAFHFPLMPRIYMALRQEDRLPITDIMAQTPAIPDNCQWGLFLRNHDELTLEMVTDDERDYMYFAYSADPRMRVNVGIRRRLAPLLDNNRRRIELLNSLLLSFPGTPILYYGDEIGMGDNIYLGDRNGVRTPMQWTSDRNAGFSRCDPARLYFPVIMDPIYGYQVVNVEAQLSDQSSLLHWSRNMIALRKLFQVFGRGTLTFLNPENRKVLAYLRQLERPDGSHEIVLCVANLSRFAQPVSLDLKQFTGMQPVEMLGYVTFPVITDGPYSLTLAPYSFIWFELQSAVTPAESVLDPALDVDRDVHFDEALVRELVANGWSSWIAESGTDHFQTAFSGWLPRQRWFGSKTRDIQSVRALHWVELENRKSADKPSSSSTGLDILPLPPVLVFFEVRYTSGDPEIYQVPVAFSIGAEAAEIQATQPLAIIAAVHSKISECVLYDASIRPEVRERVLTLIQDNAVLPLLVPAAVEDSVAGTPPTEVNSGNTLIQGAELAPPEADRGSEDAPHPGPSDAPRAVQPPAGGVAVLPAPIDAQPGEVSSAPRSATPVLTSAAQRRQPRESPHAGAPSSFDGMLEAHPSLLFPQSPRPSQLTSRVGSAEQSNTSILYGDRFILKLFRRLQQGENPDVEIGRFLSEIARFSRIPKFFGEISITPEGGEKSTIAMLQELAANEGDGWSWFIARFGEFLASVAGAAPPNPSRKVSLLDDEQNDSPDLLRNAAQSMKAAELLGTRTAELHLALATSTTDSAFAPEALDRDNLAAEAQRIEEHANSALQLLKTKLCALEEPSLDAAIQVLAHRHELIERCKSLASFGNGGLRTRIHGDFHLGQTLRTPGAAPDSGDFLFLDFEGEPARPLFERRRKYSPLKDVAGMLRSFSYAAQSGIADSLQKANDKERTDLEGWASLWEKGASKAYMRGYRQRMAENPTILPNSETSQALLDCYLLEKALYEMTYELNNRPTWVRIPLAGILAL